MLPTLVTGSCRRFMVVTPSRKTLQAGQRLQERYPSVDVIVLDVNGFTFQHVVDVLVQHLPGMHGPTGPGSWPTGSMGRLAGGLERALEQGELYHQLLAAKAPAMAPLGRG